MNSETFKAGEYARVTGENTPMLITKVVEHGVFLNGEYYHIAHVRPVNQPKPTTARIHDHKRVAFTLLMPEAIAKDVRATIQDAENQGEKEAALGIKEAIHDWESFRNAVVADKTDHKMAIIIMLWSSIPDDEKLALMREFGKMFQVKN